MPRSRANGFTLVELLVAITLFALLSVMLFGGLRFGSRATEAGLAKIERSADIAAALSVLRGLIADAQPLEQDAGGRRKALAFAGEVDNLEMVALPPASWEVGGWHAFHIGRERGPSGERLVLSARLVRPDIAGAVSPPHPSILLDHVATVEFAYFGVRSEGEPPNWYERWVDVAALPALVRLRVAFTDGRRAPDLIVALRAAEAPWQSP